MEYFLQILSNTIVLGSLYALLALGFNFLYSANKFFDISYAAYLVVASYSYLALSKMNLPILITFIFAIMVTFLFSFIIERSLYKKLRHKKSSGAVMMIASLGVLTVTQALVAMIFTSNVQTLSSENNVYSIISIAITDVQLVIIIGTLIAYISTYLYLKYSIFGIQLRAVADNEELAMTVQLPVNKVRLIATLTGVAIGGMAAILYSMDTSLDPYTGMSLLLKGVIVAILGGLGGFMYGLVGAFILAIVENLSIWYIGGEWKDAISFSVLILILLFRPNGLFKKI